MLNEDTSKHEYCECNAQDNSNTQDNNGNEAMSYYRKTIVIHTCFLGVAEGFVAFSGKRGVSDELPEWKPVK